MRSNDLRRADDFARALAWLGRLAADRASTQRETAAGVVLLTADFPAAHDHNLVALAPSVSARDAAEAADAALGGAGLAHRLLDASRADPDALAAGLEARGYERSDELVMAFYGAPLTAPGPHVVAELDTDERARVAREGWRREFPDWPEEVCAQLGRRVTTLPADLDATFLAIRDADGRVAARTDLYVRDGIAQVEEVVTEPTARNQGLASALIRSAVQLAGAAGAALTFLVADADEGPVGLYERLGFSVLGSKASFSRPPS